MSDVIITADKTPWYQWDTGLTVTVSGGAMTECHFANRKQGTAYVQAVAKGKVKVPDELLQVAAPIKAYGYVPDGGGGQTYVEQSFEVVARNIPADYTYTKTAQKTIHDAEVARDQAYDAADTVLTVATEVIGFKNDAQASANAAKKSVDSAEYQAGRAKTNADNAGIAMANAQSSAKMSSVHATESANSAKKSEQSASASATSASEAAASASKAATSASEAKAAASNAAESATAAAKSASNAAASVDAINVIAPKRVSAAATSGSLLSVAVGSGATTNAVINAVAVGRNANAKSGGAVCVGNASGVEVGTSVAIGEASKASKNNEFSIGNDELTREITNVSTPTNDTSASTKKYTDDNDAETLREAKKYTDDNTTNALVGTVSGKLLHVEDAWPSPLLSVTIDGAYKQDGTPSPDNPVPIQLIENPVIRVTGRNLIDLPDMTVPASDVNFTLYDCGLIPNGTTAYLSMVSSNDATSKFNDAASCGLSDGTHNVYSIRPDNVTKGINKTTLTPTFDATKHVRFFGYRQASPSFDISNYQLEVGGYHDYKPYTSQSLPITLPAEHPYLAKLPGGTADTIEVDKDGNVSLVARVAKHTVERISYIQDDGAAFGLRLNIESTENVYLCEYLDKKTTLYNAEVDWLSVPKKSGPYTTADEVMQFLIGKVFFYAAKEPVTYPLGKVTMPSLPDSISNVWTDAELTTDMSMTYKQDVNVIIAGLKSQIAALTSKAASDEANADEPTIESDPDYSTGEPTIE